MAFCFQTSQCRKTSHQDMQLLVSSQMEAGMEEVLDEMVGPMMLVGKQGGNNFGQGGNGRQTGQRSPPGNGVCIVCTVRWETMDQSDQTRWKVTPRRDASNPSFLVETNLAKNTQDSFTTFTNMAKNNQDSFTTCGFCFESHWNRRQQRLELPYH